MILYEVSLEVREEVRKEYARYLPGHIAEILQIPGFVKAEWWTAEPEEGDAAKGITRWTVHYLLKDRASLEAYFQNQAPRLRGEAIQKFGDKFRAVRRVFAPTKFPR